MKFREDFSRHVRGIVWVVDSEPASWANEKHGRLFVWIVSDDGKYERSAWVDDLRVMPGTYDVASSVHRGDAFSVYKTDEGAFAIVRTDGVERIVQPGDDASEFELMLNIYGDVFDTPTAYVRNADAWLSEFFTEEG